MKKPIRLKIEDIALIKEILITPYFELFKEILDNDYKEKKELIEQIHTFKQIYIKTANKTAEETVNLLLGELEEVNGRIARLKKILKEK